MHCEFPLISFSNLYFLFQSITFLLLSEKSLCHKNSTKGAIQWTSLLISFPSLPSPIRPFTPNYQFYEGRCIVSFFFLCFEILIVYSRVSLSFCSQKSRSVIKTQRKAPFNGRLCVSEGFDSNLSFRTFRNYDCVLSVSDCSYFSNSERSNYVKMNGQDVPVQVHRSDGNLVSYWRNTTDGLKTITDYVTNLYNIDVSEVCVSKNAIKLIKWVIRRQKTPLESVTVCGVTSSEEELIYILRDCETLSQIEICSFSPRNFRFSEKFRRIDFLDIWYGEWVTLDNLLTMDGIDIILGSSSLSNNDVNVFLEHWLSGGCPRLKLFCARIGTVDILQSLDGLMHNVVFVEDRRYYTR
ncbi:hypothetical protein CRE_02789 [Caenorhabditis remanei]|uniref:Sdz-33 F-box domain-containing protein n=1 Tax=Caenorhabditis remanei TaxID=31234 RepID=E3NW15_CAERE|nr:hypothetical protein CRE_02789 [Caenorhabditis remanei]